MRCPFCLGDGKKSKEHLFSKPICDAVGIDRTAAVASLDPSSNDVGPITSFASRSLRLPCESCNSGWMSRLEVDTGLVLRRWLANGDQRLTKAGVTNLVRWLAKTAIIFSFAENDARRFMTRPTGTAVPDITTARMIFRGEPLDHVWAGASRVSPTNIVWGTGNATVTPIGPTHLSSRAVNVTALNLGSLQLWIAVPLVKPDDLRLPRSVSRLDANLRSGRLSTRTGNLDPTQVIASYSDATTDEFNRAIDQLTT